MLLQILVSHSISIRPISYKEGPAVELEPAIGSVQKKHRCHLRTRRRLRCEELGFVGIGEANGTSQLDPSKWRPYLH